jgi:hypothetical protein
MMHPNKEQSLALLKKWVDMHASIERLMGNVSSAFGSTPESPFFEVTWKNFDTHTEALTLLLVDDFDWLNWYCHDNEMGVKRMKAGFDSNLRVISSLDDLYLLIVESRTRAVA